MFPLIPCAIPDCMDGSWVEPEFNLAAHVATQCSVLVEVALAKWYMEAPTPELWRERQNTASKECLSVTGRFASNEQRAKAAVRKHSGGFGVGQQRVIAGTQVRLTNDVEG